LLSRIFPDGVEIVSADALQVYRQLDIGTAKPEEKTLSRIPHHLINIIDFTESFSVGDFCAGADEAVRSIILRGSIPVISGGTAFYLKSWLLGLPETPASDPQLRSALEAEWNDKGNDELREELRRFDPVSADRIGRGDRYRMLRALEVRQQTGRSLSSYTVPDTPRDDYDVLSLGLRRERSELYRRINKRVDEMFQDGLPEELASLRRAGAEAGHPGMKAIGYREWFGEPGEPEPDKAEVKELIARNTRRYAKRQITFFASLPDVHWFDVEDGDDIPEGLIPLINDFLNDNSSGVS